MWQALCACSRKRRDQLQELRQLWETRPSSDDDSGCGSVEENLALSAEERLFCVRLLSHCLVFAVTVLSTGNCWQK